MFPDIEAVFPFQLLALIAEISGRIHGRHRALAAFGAVMALAQLMILTRTFDKADGASRRDYFLINEIYALLSVGLIILFGSLFHR